MRAALATAYGSPDVMQVGEVPQPVPAEREILIKVMAAAVNSGDWRIRSLDVPRGFRLMVRLGFGWSKPRQPILGWECAGVVQAVGAKVSNFRVGEDVITFPNGPRGCHAEYMTVGADKPVIRKPAVLSWEEAGAFCFGGLTALNFLRRGGVAAGKRVLIVGASGSVGSAAVQIAKAAGSHVTGVCSAANRDLVLGLGADAVIDYQAEDYAARGERWDIIMDNVGGEHFGRAKSSLTPDGRLLAVVVDLPQMLRAMTSRWARRRIVFGDAGGSLADLEDLVRLAETGKYRPVLDSVYDLADVRAAHRRVDSGRKRGSVVLRIGTSQIGH